MSKVSVDLDDLQYLVEMIDPQDIYDESKNPGLAAVMLRVVDLMVAAGLSVQLGYPPVEIKMLQKYLQHHARMREGDEAREKLGLPTVGEVVPDRWK